MEHKYHEGPKAGENFEQLASTIAARMAPQSRTLPRSALGTKRGWCRLHLFHRRCIGRA
jgi:hypothetical protein